MQGALCCRSWRKIPFSSGLRYFLPCFGRELSSEPEFKRRNSNEKPEACSQPGSHRGHDFRPDGDGLQRRELRGRDSENNVEAIDVLQTVGIMVGDENGNFNPDQNVTRNEMAVVMSNLMEYNVASYANTSPFTDVPSWAEPYVPPAGPTASPPAPAPPPTAAATM